MRKIVWTSALLSVGAVMVAPIWPAPARAAVERIPFSCLEYPISLDFSGARDVATDKTFHGWGAVVTFRDEGTSDELGVYCEGTDVVRGNTNENLLTGVGQFWGTFRTELDAFPGSGFEGTYHEQFAFTEEGFASGEGVAKGYGELEGWQMRMSIQELYTESPSTSVSGYVFNPGG